MSRHLILEAEPSELAGAVDAEAILARVCTVLGHDPDVTLAPLLTEPARIKVLAPNDLEDVSLALGTTSGRPTGDCHNRGLFLPPRTILVLRLDWPGLLAHELTHLVRHLLGGPSDEAEARTVADAW